MKVAKENTLFKDYSDKEQERTQIILSSIVKYSAHICIICPYKHIPIPLTHVYMHTYTYRFTYTHLYTLIHIH